MILYFSTIIENNLDRQFQRLLEKAIGNQNLARFSTSFDEKNELPSVFFPWDLRTFSSHASKEDDGLNLPKWLCRFRECHPKISISESENRLRGFANFIDELYSITQPQLVLVNSNSVANTGIPFELAKANNIPTITYERGYLPDSYQIEPYGSGPFSTLSNLRLEEVINNSCDFDSLRLKGEQFIDSNLKNFDGRRKYQDLTDVCQKKLRDKTQKIKVLFLPIVDETFSVFPTDHPDHKKVLRNFESSLDIAKNLSDTRFELVVKPHPSDMKPEKWDEVSRFAHISHGNVATWIDWCDVVVINGGSLEFLTLARDKPVVVAGRSVLSNKSIVIESDQNDLNESVVEASKTGLSDKARENFEVFVGWLADNYLIFPKQENADQIIRERVFSHCQIQKFHGPLRTKNLVSFVKTNQLRYRMPKSRLMTLLYRCKNVAASVFSR